MAIDAQTNNKATARWVK